MHRNSVKKKGNINFYSPSLICLQKTLEVAISEGVCFFLVSDDHEWIGCEKGMHALSIFIYAKNYFSHIYIPYVSFHFIS